MEKNWALSVDQCQLQALQFSMHLINLRRILLGCDGFAGIQKTVVDQTSDRPPNSDHDFFFSARLASWSALELLLSPTTELVIVGCCIKSIFHRTSQSNEEIVHCCCLEEKMTLQNDHFFLICSQLMKHPLIELFHLSNLFQMPNVCRMVDGEFFGSFTCSCMRISFHDAFN